jgi:hypothetical protein
MFCKYNGTTLQISEILVNTFTQATSLALIAATLFDPSVDVVYSINESLYRPVFDMSHHVVPSTRTSMKMVLYLQLLDLFSPMCLLSFNIHLWSTIGRFKKRNLCPRDTGSCSFLFKKFNVSDPTSASTSSFAYDITWEFLRWLKSPQFGGSNIYSTNKRTDSVALLLKMMGISLGFSLGFH